MRRLWVMYDAGCGLCSALRAWLESQPAWLELVFVPADAPDLETRFPGLHVAAGELVVVDDAGGVYAGDHAWILCIWALEEHRALAERLARPALLPLARKAFKALSAQRGALSRLLGLPSDRELAEALAQHSLVGCGPPPVDPSGLRQSEILPESPLRP